MKVRRLGSYNMSLAGTHHGASAASGPGASLKLHSSGSSGKSGAEYGLLHKLGVLFWVALQHAPYWRGCLETRIL